MSQISGSINYRLNQTAELLCFPFTDGQVDTVQKLNNKMGGYVKDIIGPGVAATNRSASVGGNDWVGSLVNEGIKPNVGYWLKPTGSAADTWGPGQYVNTTISGTLSNPTDKYTFHLGNNLISYPFGENKPFNLAVDGDDLYYNQGVTDIIGAEASTGAQSAKSWNVGLSRWVGGINNFSSGSGYWFKTDSGGLKTIWKTPTGSNVIDFEWKPCTDGNNDDRYGSSCNTIRTKTTGWHQTSEYPFSASAHTFGWNQSQQYTLHFLSSSLGNGTSSLLDSASNNVGRIEDAKNGNYFNFVIGFFPTTASSGVNYPACCGADYWFSHEEFQNVHPGPYQQGIMDFLVNWNTNYTPFLEDTYGYTDPNSPLDVKVYDPRRDLVVPASFYNVTYDASGNPVIGNRIWISGSSLTMNFHWSGSLGVLSDSRYKGVKCIKMLE